MIPKTVKYKMRVKIIVPPGVRPDWPSMGAEVLAETIRRFGYLTSVCYAPLLQPADGSYQEFPISAAGIYSPGYFGQNVPKFAHRLAIAARDDLGVLRPQLRISEQAPLDYVTKRYIRAINAAKDLVQYVVAEILADSPDVIGFSITLDAQKMSAAAIARGLRKGGFSGRLVAGGSALDGRSPLAFMRAFAEFDAILVGEADESWVKYLRQLEMQTPDFTAVPGIIYRAGNTICVGPPEVAPHDLDMCETPDYQDYMQQYESSAWALKTRPVLMLESSRSCWWGAKRRCIFCAIDSKKRPYRVKSSQQTLAELHAVCTRFHPGSIFYTDSIFPHSFRGEHLARMTAEVEEGQWNVFYETKSTISRQTIARLACAGVREVQPGIESFSSRTLKRMRKGATALQQVNCLKWCSAYGVRAGYALIAGIPGEETVDLLRNLEILRAIGHFDPPWQLNWLGLFQTSDYYEQRGLYAFRDVQPLKTERLAYPVPESVLNDLVNIYRYTLPSHRDPDYLAAFLKIEEWIADRQKGLNVPSLVANDCGDCILVAHRAASGVQSLTTIVDKAELYLLRQCAEVRSLPGLARSGPHDQDSLTAAAIRLAAAQFLLIDDGWVLALTIPAGVRASVDAAWPIYPALAQGK